MCASRSAAWRRPSCARPARKASSGENDSTRAGSRRRRKSSARRSHRLTTSARRRVTARASRRICSGSFSATPRLPHTAPRLDSHGRAGIRLDFEDIRMESKNGPLDDLTVAHAAADAVRKAHAVRLIERSPDFPELTYPEVRQAAARVREAGIATYAAGIVARRDPPGAVELTRALRDIDARLEESPLPETEWPRVVAILESDQLAALLGISASSLVRYAKGERRTPDEMACRLNL